MAFPVSPTNGQQVVVNGILYTYTAASQSWTRVQGVAGNITATGNISANNFISNSLITGTINANSTATVNALTSNGAISGTTGTFGSGIVTTTVNANANATVAGLTVNANATISGNITASSYIISGSGVFWSNGTAYSSGGGGGGSAGNITGTGIFWPNGSPAVYNTSFWVQNQDYGFTANTVDYGNILGLVTDSVDTIYDTGTVLNGSAIDGNNIVVSTVTGDKFVNNIAIASATLTGPVSIKAMYETSTITASAPTSTTNFDVITQATQFFTSNATTDFTFNIRGNSTTTLNSVLAIGQTVTLTALITVGATGYIPTTVQVDGSTVTVNWLNGASPSSSYTSCKVSYTFTVIKTAAATFTVLGSQTRYG